MKTQKIAAIDIGTTKIVCTFAEIDESGHLTIKASASVSSVGMLRGAVRNVTQVGESIKRVVAEVEKKIGEKINRVFVGVAGDHIRSTRVNDYVVLNEEDSLIETRHLKELEEKIRNSTVSENKKILSIIAQDYFLDGERIYDVVGAMGKRLEANYHLIMADEKALRALDMALEMAEVTVIEYILEPLASALATLTGDEKEAGVIMFDIGGGTTDIAVFKDHRLVFTAVIPFGGKSITADVKKTMKLTEALSEEIKLKYGSCLPSQLGDDIIKIPNEGYGDREVSIKKVSEVIQARVDEIIKYAVSEIQRAGVSNNEIGMGIVLTGGGSQLQHLAQKISLLLGMEARMASPLLFKETKALFKPSLSTNAGLILAGIEYLKKHPDADITKSFEQEVEQEEPVAVEVEMENKKKRKRSINSFGERIFGGMTDLLFGKEEEDIKMN
jgi:cell division protein FtsA